jgi:hypothetical protein
VVVEWVPSVSCGSRLSVFLPYTYVYICNAKIFYDTDAWMVFLNFYTSTVNLSYRFLHTTKKIHMGLEFYNAMVKIFLL